MLPAPLTPRRMVEGMVVPGSVVSSPAGNTDMASGASPRELDGMRGCQYRMTSYDQESGGPDFSPVYGIQLHDPRLLEYVGAPESAGLLSCSPEYWLHHLEYEKTLTLRPRFSFNTTRASCCPTYRCCSSL